MNKKLEVSPFGGDQQTEPVKPKSTGGFTEETDEQQIPPETITEVDPDKPKTDGFREYVD